MPAAPPAGVTRPENESFAKLMAYVGTNVGVLAIRDHLKKQGLEPHEPDEDDVERTTDATAQAITRALGDAEIPWWATLVASWGSLYLSMRMGARPLQVEPQASAANDNGPRLQTLQSSASPSVSIESGNRAPAPAPPAPVLGQGVPPVPKPAGVRLSAFTGLPELSGPTQSQ